MKVLTTTSMFFRLHGVGNQNFHSDIGHHTIMQQLLASLRRDATMLFDPLRKCCLLVSMTIRSNDRTLQDCLR